MADSVPFDLDRSKHLQYSHFESHRTEYVLSWWEIIRGILPSVRYIINRDNFERRSNSRSKKIMVSEVPDTHLSEAQSGIDPYGNDYFCNICSHELANTYFHCFGCESLLAKDFNICIGCYKDGAYAIDVEMHKRGNTPMACHFHHVGKPKTQCSVASKHDMKCTECNKCLLCNCICHTVFEKRRRFYTEERQYKILERCAEIAFGAEIKFSYESECQLSGEPLISNHENQGGEENSYKRGDNTVDVSTAQSEALRIVADVCQPKQNYDDGNNISSSGMDDKCYKASSDANTLSKMQHQNIQSSCEIVEGEHDSIELTTSKTPSHTMDVIDVFDDNNESTDSDSSNSPGLLNWNTGEIQNVDIGKNYMGTQRQPEVASGEVHPIPSEEYSHTISRSAASPTVTIFDDLTFSKSQLPCIVPVGSNEHVEYDAV